MDFLKYPKLHSDESGDSVYADIINHCKSYRSFLVAGNRTTSAHEVTHGINNELRNAHGAEYGIITVNTRPRPYKFSTITHPRQCLANATVNAFYVRQDRAVVLPEPSCRKRDAIEFIPPKLRDNRYQLYVEGQTEWDSQPLYIFDEWIAYGANAACAIDDAKNGRQKSDTDEVYGVIEFVAYAVGVLMAADAHGGLDKNLAAFSAWHLREAFNLFFTGRDLFPFDGQDKIVAALQSAPEWAHQRDFLKARLNFTVPSKVLPHDEDKLAEDLFKVVGA